MSEIKSVSSTVMRRSIRAIKQMADREPVYITDRGKTTHVLLSYDEYKRLTGTERSAAEILYMPGAADVEFEPPRLDWKLGTVKF